MKNRRTLAAIQTLINRLNPESGPITAIDVGKLASTVETLITKLDRKIGPLAECDP